MGGGLLARANLAETDYRCFTAPSVGHNGVDCVCNAAVVRMSSSFQEELKTRMLTQQGRVRDTREILLGEIGNW